MVFKPSQQNPTSNGTELFGQVIHAPIQTRMRIEATVGFFEIMRQGDISPAQVGSSITDYFSTNIARFVDKNRQQRAIGGQDQQWRTWNAPGINVRYRNNQGQETLEYDVFPERAPIESVQSVFTVDTNLDGYIVVKFTGWMANTGMSFLLNGVSIYEQPSVSFLTDRFSLGGNFLFTFGKTALRCHSLNDQFNANFPNDMVPALIPARPLVKTHTSVVRPTTNITPDDPSEVGEHQDLPQYPDVAEVFVRTIHYPDLALSPLAVAGPNQLQTIFHVGVPPGGDDFLGFEIDYFAEFYSRASRRYVKQSWNRTADKILVNDKPLAWSTIKRARTSFFDPGDYPVLTQIGTPYFGFDLSGAKDDPEALAYGDSPRAALGVLFNSNANH